MTRYMTVRENTFGAQDVRYSKETQEKIANSLEVLEDLHNVVKTLIEKLETLEDEALEKLDTDIEECKSVMDIVRFQITDF